MGLLVIIFGLIIGSFLNVCIYRIPRGESIVFPPSCCPFCGNRLKFYDMVPVLSYIFLKGRCRFCKNKISTLYPIVEILTAALFFFIYKKHGLSLVSIKYMFLTAICIVVSFIDYFTMSVYYITLLPGFVVGFIFLLVDKSKTLSGILGMIIGYGMIWIIDKFGQKIFNKKSMGEGDGAFLAVLGLLLGIKLTIVAIFIAFILGGIMAAYILLSAKKSRHDYIPFAPFLGIGAYISAMFGNELIKFYLSFIL